MNPTFTTNYREMAPWLESILNDCQDAVFITDRHFNLQHWNVTAEELWFKQPDRPAKKNIVDFLNGMFPGHHEVHSQLQRAIALDEQVEDIFVAADNRRNGDDVIDLGRVLQAKHESDRQNSHHAEGAGVLYHMYSSCHKRYKKHKSKRTLCVLSAFCG